MKRLICRVFGHRIAGDNFHGHYCCRCDRQLDYGVFQKYMDRVAQKGTIHIPKIGRIKAEDISG